MLLCLVTRLQKKNVYCIAYEFQWSVYTVYIQCMYDMLDNWCLSQWHPIASVPLFVLYIYTCIFMYVYSIRYIQYTIYYNIWYTWRSYVMRNAWTSISCNYFSRLHITSHRRKERRRVIISWHAAICTRNKKKQLQNVMLPCMHGNNPIVKDGVNYPFTFTLPPEVKAAHIVP